MRLMYLSFAFKMNDLRLLLQADKLRKIINLQSKQINNLQLMMPTLTKFENLESLTLSGNRLQNLPDLGALEKLNELDISNNPFRSVLDIIPSLKSLPHLTHLMISFKNDEEQEIVKKQLPRLERLNKKPLNNVAITNKRTKKSSSVMKLNEKDLEEIAMIYDDIRDVYKKSKYFIDKELAEEFDKGVDMIMGELSNKLAVAGAEDEVNSSIVNCRYALIDLCFVKIITYFYHFDKGIASVIERIHDYIALSFRSMSEILKACADRTKTEIDQLVVKKEELFKTEIRRLKQVQETHLNQISILQAKNTQLLEKLTKNSKTNVVETTMNHIIKRKMTSKQPGKGGKSADNSSLVEGGLNIKLNKNLSLNQLKEIINQIHMSKIKHNAICLDSGLPMETLQTHMYTFLNQKYGLKPMTVQWAMSIVNGIKKYGHDDAEVSAFGKMLRNQLEEDCVEMVRKGKQTLRNAVRKLKGQESSLVSKHESQEILLIVGHKRDTIDLIMSRVKEANLQDGYLSLAYLEQLALQHSIRRHMQKIRGVSNLFKSVDTDEDGIITHDQLFAMLEKIQVKGAVDNDELIQLVDPFQTNIITFSFLLENMQKMPVFKELFV